jgi:endonuclease VIII
MPEGDTIKHLTTRLNAALSGHTILHAEFNVAKHATVDVDGHLIVEVVPRGKHILMRLEGPADERVTVHSHLRMDGMWELVQTSASWRPRRGFEVRAVIHTEPWTAVGRLLGELDVLPTADESRVVGHLGPDLLDDTFDRREAASRLLVDPARPIAEALLDQRNLAGLGNELVNEVLFLRGVWPWTQAGGVELDALLALALRLIRANSTRAIRSSTGDLRMGRRAYVFDRGGQQCRRCGSTIQVGETGTAPISRAAWWCPTCQTKC